MTCLNIGSCGFVNIASSAKILGNLNSYLLTELYQGSTETLYRPMYMWGNFSIPLETIEDVQSGLWGDFLKSIRCYLKENLEWKLPKVLILMKSNLFIFFFYRTCFWCYNKLNQILGLKGFFHIFFFWRCYVLLFKSMIHFQSVFAWDMRVRLSF